MFNQNQFQSKAQDFLRFSVRSKPKTEVDSSKTIQRVKRAVSCGLPGASLIETGVKEIPVVVKTDDSLTAVSAIQVYSQKGRDLETLGATVVSEWAFARDLPKMDGFDFDPENALLLEKQVFMPDGIKGAVCYFDFAVAYRYSLRIDILALEKAVAVALRSGRDGIPVKVTDRDLEKIGIFPEVVEKARRLRLCQEWISNYAK